MSLYPQPLSDVPSSLLSSSTKLLWGQEAYDKAVNELFDTLDMVDVHLGSSRYLCGDKLTLADVCLFTALITMACSSAPKRSCLSTQISTPICVTFTRKFLPSLDNGIVGFSYIFMLTVNRLSLYVLNRFQRLLRLVIFLRSWMDTATYFFH